MGSSSGPENLELPDRRIMEEIEVILSEMGSSSGPENLELPDRRIMEEIGVILSRWDGLRIAVENQWGGSDSLRKSKLLAKNVVSWLSQSKGQMCVEDLENSLHEFLLLSLNTDIVDGSIEEVAEQLMIFYEEHLQDSFQGD